MVTLFKARKSKKYFSALSRAARRGGPVDEVREAHRKVVELAGVRSRRIGIAKGEFEVPAEIDGEAEFIRELFGCR